MVREEVRAAVAEVLTRNAPVRASDEGGYVSIGGAAAVAAVHPGTLRRWIRTGRLPVRRAGRVYRIARAELEAFLEREGRSADVVEKARGIVKRPG
jgi:excisionase family DNA binding protein